jgi:hypothetical protein
MSAECHRGWSAAPFLVGQHDPSRFNNGLSLKFTAVDRVVQRPADRTASRQRDERQMNKSSIVIFAAALGVAVPAEAGFINLNAPDDPGPAFTSLPGGMVQVSGTTSGTIAGYQYTGQPACCALENASASFDTNFTGSGMGGFSFAGKIFASDMSGTLIASDQMTASINWTTAGASTTSASLSGIGTVLTSSGDNAFEGDFPVGGIFDISAGYLTGCGRFPITCGPNPQVGGSVMLIGGSLTPIPAPAPVLGKGWLAALLTLALITVSKIIVMPRK